mgnify:CR=1 FL=1
MAERRGAPPLELVTLYIKEHPDEFRIATAELPAGLYRPSTGSPWTRPRTCGCMQALFERLSHAGPHRRRRARRSRSSTASPRSPRSTPTCATRRHNLRSVALDARRPSSHEHEVRRFDDRRAPRRHRRALLRDRRGRASTTTATSQLGYKLDRDRGASGADAIKFQSYTAGKISTRIAPRYWVEPKDPNGTPVGHLRPARQAVATRDFKALLGHAQHVGLTAFSTPFDDEAVDFLASLDVPAFKIASADLTCHPLIGRAPRVAASR